MTLSNAKDIGSGGGSGSGSGGSGGSSSGGGGGGDGDDNVQREARVGVSPAAAASCLPFLIASYVSLVRVRDYKQRTGDAVAGAGAYSRPLFSST
jgi:hypothetical protein